MGFGDNIKRGFSLQYKTSSLIDPDAILIFNAITANSGSAPSDADKTKINGIVKDLKTTVQWNEMDALQVYIGNSLTSIVVDFRTPSRIAVVNNVVGTTFLSYGYVKGNGTSTNIDTKFNPGDGGTYKFTRDSHYAAVYQLENKSENKTVLSCLNASNQGYELNWFPASGNGGQWTYKAGTGTAVLMTNILNPIGLVGVQRTGSTISTMNKNGFLTDADVSAVASIAPPNRSIKLLARDSNGTFSNWATVKIGFFVAGSGNLNGDIINNILCKWILNPLGLAPTKRVTIQGNSFINGLILPNRLRVNLGYTDIDFNQHGTGGFTTTQLLAEAPNYIFNRYPSYVSKDVAIIQELTNGFAANPTLAGAIAEVNRLVQWATLAKAGGYKKVIVNTMFPRGSIGAAGNGFRQNDSNLFDPNTLNGMIRNTPTGTSTSWDYVSDGGSDPEMGIYSNGVAGVGEKNTAFYAVDETHPITPGYQRYADNYMSPVIALAIA